MKKLRKRWSGQKRMTRLERYKPAIEPTGNT